MGNAADRDPFRASLADCERDARALHDALHAGDDDAAWRFKWQHARFRGSHVDEVRAATHELGLDDARQVVAHDLGFATWDDLVAFSRAVQADGPVRRFESAVEAVVDGDVAALARLLREDPALVHARSTRRHHATLLHYVAANGVEDTRQRTPANAVDVARTLLDAGADPDALADMYEHRCTTMSMLVSSAHPARAGVQAALAELLADRGAALEGAGTGWSSAVMTALQFGYPATAEALVRRGAPVRDLVAAAGLGRVDDVRRLLPGADAESRHAALALAAQLGRRDAVALLLDAGEDPDRYNPHDFHGHATPLHHAALGGHMDVVRLLVERGARLDIADAIYDGTPLGWAEHGGQSAVAEYLRARMRPARVEGPA
jgi:hypothetical protein